MKAMQKVKKHTLFKIRIHTLENGRLAFRMDMAFIHLVAKKFSTEEAF
jgi:hypothetical protein